VGLKDGPVKWRRERKSRIKNRNPKQQQRLQRAKREKDQKGIPIQGRTKIMHKATQDQARPRPTNVREKSAQRNETLPLTLPGKGGKKKRKKKPDAINARSLNVKVQET